MSQQTCGLFNQVSPAPLACFQAAGNRSSFAYGCFVRSVACVGAAVRELEQLLTHDTLCLAHANAKAEDVVKRVLGGTHLPHVRGPRGLVSQRRRRRTNLLPLPELRAVREPLLRARLLLPLLHAGEGALAAGWRAGGRASRGQAVGDDLRRRLAQALPDPALIVDRRAGALERLIFCGELRQQRAVIDERR